MFWLRLWDPSCSSFYVRACAMIWSARGGRPAVFDLLVKRGAAPAVKAAHAGHSRSWQGGPLSVDPLVKNGPAEACHVLLKREGTFAPILSTSL